MVYLKFMTNENKEFKMLKINHLDHINLFVSDLDKSVEFYQRYFGFKTFQQGVAFESKNKYKIIGLRGKLYLCLYESHEKFEIAGINHIGLNLDNFDEAFTYLKQEKVDFLYDGVNQYENSRSFYIQDPDGYEIELSDVFGGGL